MHTPHRRVVLLSAAVAAVALPGVTRPAFGTAKVYTPTAASDTWNLNSNWGTLSGTTITPNAGIPVATSRTTTDSGDSADFRLEGIPAALQTAPVIVDTGADQAVTSLRFQGTALPTGGSYVINNNTITLYGLNNGNGIVYQISSSVTINSNLKITADEFFFSGGAGGAGITYNGAISESAPSTLTRNQTGVATFTNPNNSFTGGLVITDGTLRVMNDGAMGAAYDGTIGKGTNLKGQVTLKSGGTLTLLSSFDSNRPFLLSNVATSNNSGFVNFSTGGFNATFSGLFSNQNANPATLNKNGNGTLTLTANNTYNAGTMVSAGVLKVASDANLGAAYDGSLAGFIIPNNGTGYVSASTTVTLTGGAPTTPAVATATVPSSGGNAGTVTAINLTNAGAGYVYAPTVTIAGAGTGATATAYVKGLLTIRNGGTLQTAAAMTSNRPVVLSGTGGGTIDTNGFDSAFTGIFNNGASGTGTFAKSGAGTLTLTGANTYTGLTTVNAGTLLLGPNAWNPVLTAAGADIKGGQLVFDYTATASPAPTVFAKIAAATIKTSNASATQTIGMLDDAAASKVTVAFTYYGDANLDGKLNPDDYALIDRGFAAGLTGWVNGDFNYSGAVDSADYLLIDSTYIASGVPHAPEIDALLATRQSQFGDAYVTQLLASVPEPTTLLAACGLATPFVTRRRRPR